MRACRWPHTQAPAVGLKVGEVDGELKERGRVLQESLTRSSGLIVGGELGFILIGEVSVQG